MTLKADVVIIGGGIVGAACAYYLCAAGLDVHLVERHFPASGTSRACDGLILLWDKSGAGLELGRASAALWGDLSETLDPGTTSSPAFDRHRDVSEGDVGERGGRPWNPLRRQPLPRIGSQMPAQAAGTRRASIRHQRVVGRSSESVRNAA